MNTFPVHQNISADEAKVGIAQVAVANQDMSEADLALLIDSLQDGSEVVETVETVEVVKDSDSEESEADWEKESDDDEDSEDNDDLEDELDDADEVKEVPKTAEELAAIQAAMEEDGFTIVKRKQRKTHKRSKAVDLTPRASPVDEVVEEVEVEMEVTVDEPKMEWGPVMAVPVKLNEDDFPALGAAPKVVVHAVKAVNKSPKAPKQSQKSKKRGGTRTDITALIMQGHTYGAQLHAERKARIQDERDQAFAKLENKDELSASLEGTKVCKYVVRNEETGEFGVCYREKCTFAHSLSSLKDPLCAFGNKCRHINGRKDHKTGRLDKSKVCMFRHPFETRDQYLDRTGKDMPDLPETDETTRKPKPKTKKVKKTKKASSGQKVLGAGHQQKTNVRHPKKRIDLTPTKPRDVPTTPLSSPRKVERKVSVDPGTNKCPWAPKKIRKDTPALVPTKAPFQSPRSSPRLRRHDSNIGPHTQYLKAYMPPLNLDDVDADSTTATPRTPTNTDETVIRVPAALAEKAMEMALARGVNFRLEIV